MQQHIADVGARHSRDAKLTVASYLLAEPAFRRTEGVRVLNYPIAHHRYMQGFVAEEAEREPGFARTLPNWNLQPSWVEPRLDAECALADRILVGSTFARDSFVSEGVPAEKLLVSPVRRRYAAVRASRAEFANKTDELRLLFVGQIAQRKGISYLLDARMQAFRRADTAHLDREILGQRTRRWHLTAISFAIFPICPRRTAGNHHQAPMCSSFRP